MSVLDLNGVSDALERKRLHTQVLQAARAQIQGKCVLILLGWMAVVIATKALGWYPAIPNRWVRGVVTILAMLPAMALMKWLLDRARRREMVEQLRFELRCVECGYPLKGSAGTTCPECGAPRPFPMTAQSDNAATQPAARDTDARD